jgi:hypothetical protein
MTAGQAAMHWAFGAKKFSNGKPEAGNLPLIGGGHFDNFSLSVLETSTTPDFPFNATLATKTFPHIAPFYGPDLLASAEPKQAALDAIGGLQALQILNNPLRIAQTESSCFSCHFNDQTVESLRGKGLDAGDTPSRYLSVDGKAPSIAKIFQVHGRRSNFHVFSYGGDFTPGVSIRVINETDDVRTLLNSIYP